MARHNDVRLYGMVCDYPETYENDGTILYSRVHLAVVRSERDDHINDKETISYDWPVINSYEPDMARKISKLQPYDIVEVQGVFVTQKCYKVAVCSKCGKMNEIKGVFEYVYPNFLMKRNLSPFTKDQAKQALLENREISNNISIIGNLCGEPNYYKNKEKRIETGSMQIGADRNLFLKFDDPSVHSDYPFIRSYGKDAEKNYYCLHKGSGVLIEGYIHTRTFERKSKCQAEACGEEFEWPDTMTEIIPYTTQYLTNYTDPSNIDEVKKQKMEEKLARYAAEGEDLNAEFENSVLMG